MKMKRRIEMMMNKEQMRAMKREDEESRNEHPSDEMKRRKGRT